MKHPLYAIDFELMPLLRSYYSYSLQRPQKMEGQRRQKQFHSTTICRIKILRHLNLCTSNSYLNYLVTIVVLICFLVDIRWRKYNCVSAFQQQQMYYPFWSHQTSLRIKDCKPNSLLQYDSYVLQSLTTTKVSASSSLPYLDNSDERRVTGPARKVNKSTTDHRLLLLKQQHLDYLRQYKYEEAYQCIYDMFSILEKRHSNRSNDNNAELLNWSQTIDTMIQAFTTRTFSPPFDNSYDCSKRIFLGVNAIQLQLSSTSGNNINNNSISSLAHPYNTVSKRTLLDALFALTSMNVERDRKHPSTSEIINQASDEAFRVLQRLVTGVGVRNLKAQGFNNVNEYNSNTQTKNGKVKDLISYPTASNESKIEMYIAEQDFNRVINSFSNAGRMDMVHRVLALQERTAHAPPLSPVSYSILFKGYGRLHDIQNVELVLFHAIQNSIEPDTILLNSLIDAYVNCNSIDKAKQLLHYMTGNCDSLESQNESTSRKEESDIARWLRKCTCPRPNRRTYNTILKGLANKGSVKETLCFAEKMKQLRLWDAITTNTVVHAAITGADFQLAEEILTNYTVVKWNSEMKPRHPNVEAYTELIDSYAKSNQLSKAVSILQLMQNRGVEPSEITYTCLLGGLGRRKKIAEAKKTLAFMNSSNIRISSKSYNALISGLVNGNLQSTASGPYGSGDEWPNEELDARVDEAMKLIRDMITNEVRPNDITVAVLVDALGRCSPPRVQEASLLVKSLERQQFVKVGNIKVSTALIQLFGKSGDMKAAVDVFRSIRQPDTVAINAYLDACYRCGRDGMAKDTFEHYFHKQNSWTPNVVSYSVLISALLRQGTPGSVRQAQKKYEEMKSVRGIRPDQALVDIILKAMIRYGNQIKTLDKNSALFVKSVLADAEKLDWGDGQLERRKLAVRDRLRDVWKNEAPPVAGLNDDLFERKGWNKVDSGFRLWGGGRREVEPNHRSSKETTTCKFLESHGWNDVNSGFRIF